MENLLHTLPRFGILFFIETIAFFFLRQYRTAMDEYRYFEAIKRKREENFVLLCLLASEIPLTSQSYRNKRRFIRMSQLWHRDKLLTCLNREN
jgi:hypothetical protein